MLLLPDTGRQGARVSVQRVVSALYGCKLPQETSPYGTVTMSAGLADSSQASDAWQAVVEVADQALYRAKEAGRNRVA